MSSKSLEERVSKIEQELAALLAKPPANAPPKKDWRKAVERMAGKELLTEVFDEAMKLREADRRKARRPRAAKSKAKVLQ